MKVVVNVDLQIEVKVKDGTTLEEAEQIALFHADLTPSLSCDLEEKFIDIKTIDIDICDVNEV